MSMLPGMRHLWCEPCENDCMHYRVGQYWWMCGYCETMWWFGKETGMPPPQPASGMYKKRTKEIRKQYQKYGAPVEGPW